MFGDNEGAIKLAEDPVGLERSKHLDSKDHRIRIQLAKNAVKLRHVSNDQRHADIITNLLAAGAFSCLRNTLMGSESSLASLRNGCLFQV